MGQDLIPVVPAAHYAIGGVAVDLGPHQPTRAFGCWRDGLYRGSWCQQTGEHFLIRMFGLGLEAGKTAAAEFKDVSFLITPWRYQNGDVDPALVAQDYRPCVTLWDYVGLFARQNVWPGLRKCSGRFY